METQASLTRRLALGLTPLAVAAAPVVIGGGLYGGSGVAAFACFAVLASTVIGVASELTASALAPREPLLRMLIGMGVRGTAAAGLILLAVAASNLDSKTIVVVALPLYLSLIAGEITQAAVLQGKGSSTAVLEANRGGL